MTKNELIFIEMRPNEGYMLTDGEIYTDYVCVMNREDLVNVWTEVKIEDIPTQLSEEDDKKAEDKE